MNKMKPYDAKLRTTKALLDELLLRVPIAESRLNPFKKLTQECSDRIRQYGEQHMLHYVKTWFRSFLGIRDECMILISGEIIRSYHIDTNKKFIHDRSKETKYYKDCSLTACSEDGISYEYRQLVEEFQEQSAFDIVASNSEALGTRLNTLSKSIDACYNIIESASKAHKDCRVTFSSRKHCAEELEVEEGGHTVSLQSASLRKCSQAKALTAVVEDPPSIDQQAVKTISDGRLRKKRRLDLQDSSDDEAAAEVAAATLLVQAKTKAKEDMNFQFTASLEQIKMAYQPAEDPQEEVLEMDSSSNAPHLQRLHHAECHLHGLAELQRCVMKFKVLDPSKGVEEAEQGSIPLSLSLQSAVALLTAQQQAKCDQLVSASALLDEITKLLWMQPLPQLAADRCDDLRSLQQLERARTSSSQQAASHPAAALWIPQMLRIDGVKYTKGSVISLPAQEPGKVKIFAVRCDAHPEVLAFTQTLHSWLWQGNKLARKDVLDRQHLLWMHRETVHSFCRYLRKRSADAAAALLLYALTCRGDASQAELIMSMKLMMLQYVSRDNMLQVKASTALAAVDLWMLSKYGDKVDASNCGLSPVILARAQSGSLPFLPALKVQEMDLSHNPLLSYLALQSHPSVQQLLSGLSDATQSSITVLDTASWQLLQESHELATVLQQLLLDIEEEEWKDPWVEMATMLLTNAPNLTILQLRRCAESYWQMLVLMAGLITAAQLSHRTMLIEDTGEYSEVVQAANKVLQESCLNIASAGTRHLTVVLGDVATSYLMQLD